MWEGNVSTLGCGEVPAGRLSRSCHHVRVGYSANMPIQGLYRVERLERACREITEGMRDLLHKEVVKRTPVALAPEGMSSRLFGTKRGRLPGTLVKNWRSGPVLEGASGTGIKRFSANEMNDDPVFEFVEWSTKPHWIRPRKDRGAASVLATGKARKSGRDPAASLAWMGPGGRLVFAREVFHPGTQGVHMTRDGLAATAVKWPKEVGMPGLVKWARAESAA